MGWYKMKKSALRQIIKEEIQVILNEDIVSITDINKLSHGKIKNIRKFIDNVFSGEYRQKYGLETDSNSRYFELVHRHRYSDLQAQADIFADKIGTNKIKEL